MRNEELERAQDALRRAGFDLAILAAPSNICYLSSWETPLPIDAGWEFAEGPALILLAVSQGQAILLCPDAWRNLAAVGNRIEDFRPFPCVSFDAPLDGVSAFQDALRTALRDLGAGTSTAVLGIEPRYLPQRVLDLLQREFGGLALRDVTPAMQDARLIKTEREIALIRNAVVAADAGQEELRRRCMTDAAGRSEVEIYAGVHAAAHQAAGGPVSVVGELVSGSRTGVVRYPGGPIDRRMAHGDTVIQDISVRVKGYWSDCTNTLVVDAKPNAEQRRYFGAARAAFEASIEALRPGARASDAVEAARLVFLRHGFDINPYCGHQIGAAVNEQPRLIRYDQTPIQAGMVFAVEPGVYGGEELGVGARAERVIVVRQSGPEILSTFKWGFEA